MIATWMLFGVVTSALLAMAGALIEPVLLRSGRAVRWVWVSAMWGAVVVIVLALRTPAPEQHSVEMLRAPIVSPVDAPTSVVTIPRLSTAGATQPSRLAAPAASMVEQLAALDRPLIWLWVATSMTLLVLLTMSATQLSRGRTHVDKLLPVNDALVVVTEQIGPAAVGVFRPRVLLPSWVVSLEPDLRALVLRHEREHLTARDPLTLLGCVTLLVLLPWNVPLWWMSRRLRAAIELDCDARVLRADSDVRRYASLLMLIGARRKARGPVMRVAAMAVMPMASGRAALQRRIVAMTTPRRAGMSRAGAFAVVAATALLAMAMLMPAPARLEARQSTPVASKAAPTDSVIEFRYLLRSSGYLIKDGKRGATIYEFSSTEKLLDPYGGFRTLKVTTTSGKSADVQLYIERDPSERAVHSDTAVFRTPFQLTLWAEGKRTHIRSVHGDSLVMSSPVAVAAPFATRSVGLHFVLQGVTWHGLPER